MNEKTPKALSSLLVADDLGERSSKGRLRSRLVRDNAIELAKKLNLQVDYLYVHNLNSGFFKKNQLQMFLPAFDSIKASIENEFAKAHVPLKIKIKYGVPQDEILGELNLVNEPQMIVLGTHGNTGLKKVLLGSVAEEILRNSHLPVFVLGPVAQAEQSILKLTRSLNILFLTDLTEASQSAEKIVIRLCKDFNCSVLILHSIGDQIKNLRQTFASSHHVPFDADSMFTQMRADAQRELQRKTRNWLKQGLNATSILIEKEEGLEKSFKGKVRSQTDLVIMGTHSRTKVVKAFLGSTARKIALESPVPVIIVPSRR